MAGYVVVMGPTAVGKTAWAVEAARAVGGEIVNADAFQLYRGLDIGTGKPTAQERGDVPHHLLDELDPDETCSAGDWARRAAVLLDEIDARGGVPFVVGGTGLYLRALTEGLSPVPRTPPEVRERWRERLAGEGLARLRSELERLDPEAAARIPAADTHRVMRALEVVDASGVPWSTWVRKPRLPVTSRTPRKFGLTVERGLLYDAIRRRVHGMIQEGWVEEVRSLLARGWEATAPGFRALGYQCWAEHLSGRRDREEAIERIVRETRQYAKRQMTWFRRERDVEWLEATPRNGSWAFPAVEV